MNLELFYALYHVGASGRVVSTVVVFFAEYFPFVICALLLLPLVFKKEGRWEYLKSLVIISCITALAWVFSSVIKHILPTPRPYVSLVGVESLLTPGDDGSFPSGHTTAFIALAFSFYFFGYKRMGKILLLGALLIGIARIMAGVHYPIDILGGAVLGFLVAKVAIYIKKRFWDKESIV
jgi:undecaprenyl-diphosphatase